MKFKLIYITDNILKEDNAPSLHIIEVCQHLKKLGVNLLLLAPSLGKYETNDFKIKYVYTTKKFKSLFFQPLLLIHLINELRVGGKIVIYIRYDQFLMLPILLARILSVKCILEVNGKLNEETAFLTNNFGILYRVYKAIDKISFLMASKIVTVTEGLRKYIISEYKISPRKIQVIENGVALENFKKTRRANLNKKNYTIGYVGSLYRYQGIDYIIDSAKVVSEKYPNVKYIIIGNGTLREKKEFIAKVNALKLNKIIKLIGPFTHNKVIEYINSFDICLCYPTSFRDNSTSPFKVYEYLASSKAVICSDIKGLRETFGNNVLYAKPENAEDLIKQTKLLINNDKVKKNLESKGVKFIRNGHTWKDVSIKLERVIQLAINRK